MRGSPEPSFEDLQRTVAVARLLLGPRHEHPGAAQPVSPRRYPGSLAAGLNDWGGISPLTLDHINPEAPGRCSLALRDATESRGLRASRAARVYPEYIVDGAEFLDESLRQRAEALDGLATGS